MLCEYVHMYGVEALLCHQNFIRLETALTFIDNFLNHYKYTR